MTLAIPSSRSPGFLRFALQDEGRLLRAVAMFRQDRARRGLPMRSSCEFIVRQSFAPADCPF